MEKEIEYVSVKRIDRFCKRVYWVILIMIGSIGVIRLLLHKINVQISDSIDTTIGYTVLFMFGY